MEGADKPEAFLGESEQRIREQTWLQERGGHDRAAEERIFEYEKLLPVVTEHIRELDGQMLEMRTAGIPDAKAYDRIRRDLTEMHTKLSELHRQVGEIADGVARSSPGVMRHAREVQDSLQREFETREDAFKFALGSHDAWTREYAARESAHYGRRRVDYGEYHKRLMPIEQYDELVTKLQEMVAALESQTDLFVRKGKISEVADDLLRQLDDIQENLQEKLDTETFEPDKSKERRSLVGMMDRLRLRISQERAKHTPAAVATARAKYSFVKDSYASSAHLLTEPQRREMRSYLARLTGLVNDLETSHRIKHTMSRAAEQAPVITDAVLRSRI